MLTLPIICATDYKSTGTIKLDIKDGGNLICGVIRVAKDGLHALKFKELGQLDLLAQAGGQVAGPRVHFCKEARFEELVALGGLSTKLDFIHKISFFPYFRSVCILLVLSF